MDGNISSGDHWTKESRLRKRIRRTYRELEGEGEGAGSFLQYSYDIREKLRDERFLSNDGVIQHFQNGRNLNIRYLQANGFECPMIFHDTEGLDMKMPPSSFSISDVMNSIGPSRMVDVMDCNSQEGLAMSLDRFCKYYQDRALGKDHRLLNVISLEFSHTPLDRMVEAPRVVRELDWVNLVWPKEMRESQTEPTNDMRRMMYPKVQKYCLMSVAGCYTDFHLDFGGTSVWYHVLKGEKVFFLIPPSSEAYCRFEEWQRHGQQEETFFPDLVENCSLVCLKEGDTLLLPSGWIHGVYTPKQSLVFGGNFLNSFHISQQLEVSKIERKLKVQDRFCYPFYSQIHWYLIQQYNHCFTELLNSRDPADTKRNNRTNEAPYPPGKWVESVAVSKFPISSFRLKTMPKGDVPSPYIPPSERGGLVTLIGKMKDGLFRSGAPGEIGNPHSLLSLVETQLHLRTLWAHTPNGMTILGMRSGKEEQGVVSVKQDFEVIDIIEEFLNDGNMKERGGHFEGVSNNMAVPAPDVLKQAIADSCNRPSNSPIQLPRQLDHTHQQQQTDNSKLIDELMQNTFGDKSELSPQRTNNDPVPYSLNVLSDLSTEQMFQFLTGEQKNTTQQDMNSVSSHMTQIGDHMTPVNSHVTSLNHHANNHAAPVSDHVTSTNDHMTPVNDHMTPVNDHMTPTIPDIPVLTPDHMTQLLDHVTMLSGIPLTGLNKDNSEDDAISKIVSSSLDLLSPGPVPMPIPVSIPTTALSLSTLPPFSLTSRGNRNSLSSPLDKVSSKASFFDPTVSQSLNYPTLILKDPPSKPSSLPILPSPILPVSNSNMETTPNAPKPSPSSQYTPDKDFKRRLSKTGGSSGAGRKSRNGAKLLKKPASRKSRCGKCDGCKRSPCGECKFCLDSVRMGGFGKLKKACIERRCSNMVEPKSSTLLSADSPTNPLYQIPTLKHSKKELVKTIKRDPKRVSVSSLSSTPTLDNDPTTVEVLSMGFANNTGVESPTSEDLMLQPDSFGLGVADDLNPSSMVTNADSITSSNSRESPLMRINDTFCPEDPLFNTSSISSIHAQVLSSPAGLPTLDLFSFPSRSSISESDLALHLSEDNV